MASRLDEARNVHRKAVELVSRTPKRPPSWKVGKVNNTAFGIWNKTAVGVAKITVIPFTDEAEKCEPSVFDLPPFPSSFRRPGGAANGIEGDGLKGCGTGGNASGGGFDVGVGNLPFTRKKRVGMGLPTK